MAELKDKLVTLEDLKIVYDYLKPQYNLPSYTEADEGKVLAIVNGELAWTEISGVQVGDKVGYISNNTITVDGISAGTYTLYYEDENNTKLTDWKPICTVEVS